MKAHYNVIKLERKLLFHLYLYLESDTSIMINVLYFVLSNNDDINYDDTKSQDLLSNNIFFKLLQNPQQQITRNCNTYDYLNNYH